MIPPDNPTPPNSIGPGWFYWFLKLSWVGVVNF